MSRPDHNAPDKIDEHYRQQLSALLDGALSLDEARFLLRRLQHDVELGDCWERWQLCGDILRGQARVELPDQLLPADFAARVAQAIATDTTDAATPSATAQASRWMRWGGSAALAASVAVVALMAVRQSPESIQPGASDPVEVVAAPAQSPPSVVADVDVASTSPASVAPDPGATVVAGVAAAAAQAPRRVMTARTRARNVATPVAVVVSAQPDTNDTADAATTDATTAMAAVPAQDEADGQLEGFVLRQPPRTRPWPRALVPDYPASGGFNVGHPGTITTSSFQPFEGRIPAEEDVQADAPVNTPR